MLGPLVEIHARVAATVDLRFERFLHGAIDWGTRLLAIVGPRGVGKTTLLLQHYRQAYDDPARCLYVSADNVQAQSIGLYELAGEFFRTGGELLLIDEVHRYPSWAAEVKSIYDAYPAGRIALSGSSLLDILRDGADLSRRLVTYPLPPLSFREYLCLETGEAFEPVDLPTLLARHTTLAAGIVPRAGGTIVDHFRRYLDHGAYPFYLEGEALFHDKLANVVEKVLSGDIPSVAGVRPRSIPVLRKMLYLVASSQPFQPNVERMARALGTSREYVYQFMEHLARARLLALLPPAGRGLRAVRKPARVFLDDLNVFVSILGTEGTRAHIGAVRETFFLQQVGTVAPLFADPKVDFRTSEGLRFEVGGRSKTATQLEGDPNAWLVVDDTEVGSGHRVPLWLFGFLY